ncbi:hypothetical protein D9613_002749 [Agrocybe pediades]|uniref:Uncharacterized protein n=1 Tax=Agrocybe pediades TaxID=84607 RepID=A0A8H4VP43_9AGAR|nr:hypothetical protein D9613_002749 [Agrocybe pediades]
MALSLSVHPLHDVLPMYGQPDSSSAYSLSGHVTVAISSPYSLFSSRRTARMLLHSVSLTFEGQSEIYTPTTGYSSLRLCSVTRELVSSSPIELSNEGHEDDADPCAWNFIFDIPIPGWLPATTSLGLENLGIRYALYATAKFSLMEDDRSTSWSFASLCAPFTSRMKYAEGAAPIIVRRFIAAPKAELTDVPTVNYLISSTSISEEQQAQARISPDILSKIQALVSLPEYIDVNESAIPLTIRVRTEDLAVEHCKRIQLTELELDLTQQEQCRYRPSTQYLSRFPLPPKEKQPPHLPLRNPHPISAIYDVGLYTSDEFSEAVCRTFSLLPDNESGRHPLPYNIYPFVNDATSPTWYNMDTSIPFIQRSFRVNNGETFDSSIEWAGHKDLRASSDSPLYSVTHELLVSLTCSYDTEGGEVTQQKLNFRIPVTFANVAPRLSIDSPTCSYEHDHSALIHTEPLPMNLPAYSQLYDSNGDRKVDYSIPLPLYTPRPPTPPSFSESVNLLYDCTPGESSRTQRPTVVASHSSGNINAYRTEIDNEKTTIPVLAQEEPSGLI